MTSIPRLRADTGLCEYEHPENWFRANSGAREAARICTNCPVIVTCAERALRLEVADGVWATVVMPGGRNAAALEAARARLREVIDRYRHQPPQLRRRSLEIRRAMHFAAVQRHMRSHPITHPQTAATEKASA